MAHLSTTEIDDIAAAAIDFRLPTLIDNVYVGTPLIKALDIRKRVVAQGGANISQPFIYGRASSSSYHGFDTMDIARRKTKTRLILEWKQYYGIVSIDGFTALATAGPDAIFDMVDTEMQEAEMALVEGMGTDIFLDGTGNFSKALDGLQAAIATTGVYGGINRSTDTEGPALRGNVDATGGDLLLTSLQGSWGAATHGGKHPDLIIGDQKLYDRIWAHVHPMQRLPIGPLAEAMADRGPTGQAGFDSIRFNTAMVVVDEKSPSGMLSLLNLDYMAYVAHVARANMEVQGPVTAINQDGKVWKILWMGNLVVGSPRMQALMTNLTEP